MLVRLVYASRAVEPVSAEVMNAILRHSRQHNPAHGITGVLCCSGGVYLQALEGDRAAVNRLYARIVADARHREVELLAYDSIIERRFASWAMGQVPLSRLNPALLLKYSASAVLDPFAQPGALSLALLDELAATASIVGQL